MKNKKQFKTMIGIGIVALAGIFLVAADHIDAPAVKGGTSDITDFYAFQGANTNNMVFVADLQGLMSPASTGAAVFDENVLIEFNIDNNGDNVEDLVIQAIPRAGKMYFFGPFKPSATGLISTIGATQAGSVEITKYGQTVKKETTNGISFFAGPRDDPFFFDFAKYSNIIGGTASAFSNPGDDTFKGTNVMSIVVEVPKTLLGTSATINTWLETKRK